MVGEARTSRGKSHPAALGLDQPRAGLLARAAICCETVDVVRWWVSATARIEPIREGDGN